MIGLGNWIDSEVVRAVGFSLLHFLWQGALIAAVLHVGLRWIPSRRANTRYLLSSLACVLMGLMPLMTFAVVYSPASISSATPAAQSGAVRHAELHASASAVVHHHHGFLEHLLPWAVLFWAGGVLLLQLRFLRDLGAAHRLRVMGIRSLPDKWAEELQQLKSVLGIRRAVSVVESSLAQVPTVVGWLRPVILVPTCALTGLSEEQLRAILAHELAHIRRCDYLINLIQSFIEALLFYHPAVWWVSNRVRQEREHCCDDVAVTACGDVLTYARALAELDQARELRPRAALGANGGSLMQRIRRLIEPQSGSQRGATSWAISGVMTLGVLAFAPLAALAQQEQDDKLCPDCAKKVKKWASQEGDGPTKSKKAKKHVFFPGKGQDGAAKHDFFIKKDEGGEQGWVTLNGEDAVQGTVVDANGEPVKGAIIKLQDGKNVFRIHGETDAKGLFKFSGPGDGTDLSFPFAVGKNGESMSHFFSQEDGKWRVSTGDGECESGQPGFFTFDATTGEPTDNPFEAHGFTFDWTTDKPHGLFAMPSPGQSGYMTFVMPGNDGEMKFFGMDGTESGKWRFPGKMTGEFEIDLHFPEHGTIHSGDGEHSFFWRKADAHSGHEHEHGHDHEHGKSHEHGKKKGKNTFFRKVESGKDGTHSFRGWFDAQSGKQRPGGLQFQVWDGEDECQDGKNFRWYTPQTGQLFLNVPGDVDSESFMLPWAPKDVQYFQWKDPKHEDVEHYFWTPGSKGSKMPDFMKFDPADAKQGVHMWWVDADGEVKQFDPSESGKEISEHAQRWYFPGKSKPKSKDKGKTKKKSKTAGCTDCGCTGGHQAVA